MCSTFELHLHSSYEIGNIICSGYVLAFHLCIFLAWMKHTIWVRLSLGVFTPWWRERVYSETLNTGSKHSACAGSSGVLAAQVCWLFARSTASVSLSCWAPASQPLKCCPFSRPINGGQDCPGVNFEYQLCNTEECQKHFEDFRAQQCQQRNSHFEYQNTKHHWLPHEHPDCE